METDLDMAYQALKRTRDAPNEIISDDAGDAGRGAAEALAQSFAVNLWARADGDRDEYKRLYEELAPKAMVMITCVVGVVRDMARGESNEQLDAFLNGVMNGGKA
jgi:hypothetical protein